MTSYMPTLLGLSLSLLLMGAQATEVPEGTILAKQQVLKRSLFGEVESLDPHLSIGIPGGHVIRDLFEGLVIYDDQGAIAPGMAERWSVSDDGKTWTFFLRKELVWSDGQPLMAKDFVYSFRRLVDPKTVSKYSWYPATMAISHAEAISRGEINPLRRWA